MANNRNTNIRQYAAQVDNMTQNQYKQHKLQNINQMLSQELPTTNIDNLLLLLLLLL